MYNLVTAVVLDTTRGVFDATDVSEMPVAEFLQKYRVGYLVITHTANPEEAFLTIEAINAVEKHDVVARTTMKAWIKGYKGVFKTVRDEPLYDFTQVRFTDLHQAGYKKEAVHPRSTLDTYPLSQLTDIYLYKETVTPERLNDNVVILVNGYLHNHAKYKYGIKVSDAAKSITHSNSNQLSLLMFSESGGVQRKNIVVEMLSKQHEGLELAEETVINTGLNLKDKSIMLSFAGVMVPLGDVLNVSDAENGVLTFSPNQLNLPSLVQQASKFIFIPELEYDGRDDRTFPINLSKLKDDAFILSLFRLSQTFLIIVDKPLMLLSYEAIPNIGIYGRYVSSTHEHELIVDETGAMIPYFHRTGNKFPWTLDTHLYDVPKNRCERVAKIVETGPWRDSNGYNGESATFSGTAAHLRKLKVEFIAPAKKP